MLILGFFSSSGTKLITYILPIYPFLSVIAGSLWYDYIKKDDKITKNLLLFFNITLFTAVVLAPFVTAILPFEFGGYLYRIQTLATIIVIPFSYLVLKNIFQNKRLRAFVLEVVFISFLFGLITPMAYNLDYQFGQNDLMKFAKIAKEKNYTISTYMTGQKYSLLYYSGLKQIVFQTEKNPAWLENELKKKNNMVIIRNSEISNLPVKIINKGEKFSVIEMD